MRPAVLILCATAATGGAAAEAARTFPGRHWETRAPAQLGLQADGLDRLAEVLGGRGCIVKDGYVVKAWGDQAKKKDWASSAKPVLSTLLLFAVQEKKISGVDAKIVDLGWPLSDKDRSMTFAHLANMTSGYARPEIGRAHV